MSVQWKDVSIYGHKDTTRKPYYHTTRIDTLTLSIFYDHDHWRLSAGELLQYQIMQAKNEAEAKVEAIEWLHEWLERHLKIIEEGENPNDTSTI